MGNTAAPDVNQYRFVPCFVVFKQFAVVSDKENMFAVIWNSIFVNLRKFTGKLFFHKEVLIENDLYIIVTAIGNISVNTLSGFYCRDKPFCTGFSGKQNFCIIIGTDLIFTQIYKILEIFCDKPL